MPPKISVIIPVYNCEKYIAECLESVLGQDLREIEIIAVNDGSSDKSGEILEFYAKKDPRLSVLTQKNSGAAIARNNGLATARGDFVLFFDADDYLEIDALDSLFSRAKETAAEIVIAQSRTLNLGGDITPLEWSLKLERLPKTPTFNREDLGESIFLFCASWSWDKLYSRDFLLENNLRFVPNYFAEDVVFVFMSLVFANRISVLKKRLFVHRKREDSLEATRDRNPLDFLDAIARLEAALDAAFEGAFEDIGGGRKIAAAQMEKIKKSFVNWALDFCLWNLNSLSPRAQNRLFATLKTAFFTLNIAQHPRDFFLDQAKYQKMHYILKTPLWRYRIASLKKRYFRIRIRKNGCIIKLFGVLIFDNLEAKNENKKPKN